METQTPPGLRLSEFASVLQRGINSVFGGQIFHVIGEVSNLKVYESRKQLYFHLIEKSAELGEVIAEMSCFGFAPAFGSLQRFESETGQKLIDGIEVLMGVRVEFHATRGLKLQLVHIDPNYTIGMLRKQRQLSVERLLQENRDAVWLEGEALVTRNQKLKLPLAIRRLAVLSSEQSAGYQDFKHTLEENLYGYAFEIVLFPVLVQGEGNADALVKRLIEVFESTRSFDAVVLVRGGGSQTDLLLFDAYQLVRAIARFPIPVLTGLGHLKDVSLADLVAHSALKTPTKVAEFIVDHNASFEQKLIDLRQRLVMGVQQRLSFLQQIIDKQQNTLINHAENIISTKQRIVDNALNNVGMIAQNKLSTERSRHAVMLTQLRFLPENLIKKSLDQLHGMENLVRAYGPDAILKRGFTYVEFEGKPVNSAYKIHSGDCITIRMHDGSVYGTIQTIELYGKKERNNA